MFWGQEDNNDDGDDDGDDDDDDDDVPLDWDHGEVFWGQECGWDSQELPDFQARPAGEQNNHDGDHHHKYSSADHHHQAHLIIARAIVHARFTVAITITITSANTFPWV